jgi:threonine aldolase
VIVERLRRKFRFYDWNPATGEVRMCAFDTTPEDIDIFAAAVTMELRSG